jgi:hypothetical protein
MVPYINETAWKGNVFLNVSGARIVRFLPEAVAASWYLNIGSLDESLTSAIG